jgi:threonine/homoserine/homoserine lactone efflux protein
MQLAAPLQSLPSALTILTSMITPALLISATGTFILSTSNRLGRVVDRVRAISEKIDGLMHTGSGLEMIEERKAMLVEQLGHLSSRADLLQRSLTVLYLASGAFVACSVAIGVSALVHSSHAWIPVALGLLGACFLFYGSVMLIFEARQAVSSLRLETHFLNKLVTSQRRASGPPA